MGEYISKIPGIKKRGLKRVILVVMDFVLISICYFLAIIFRYYMAGQEVSYIFEIMNVIRGMSLLGIITLILCQWIMKQYQSIWKLAGLEDFTLGTLSFIMGTGINLMTSFLLPVRIPLLVTILAGILAMIACNGARIVWRCLRYYIITQQVFEEGDIQRTLIYGAGMGGSLVANEYRRNPQFGKKIIGFVDDNPEKSGTYIGKIPVFGTGDELEQVLMKYDIDELIIAISQMNKSDLKAITLKAKRLNVAVKTMPGLFELIDGKFNVGMIRDVSVEELLARDSIQLDYEGISDYLEQQVVMVTGGGGSIGSELCRQIAKFHPTQLIIVDIYETYRPDVVFHAAAHKHVPLMEDSPAEAIKNNVVGTLHTAELASEYGVKRFVLISTDKAVNPTNVMGATKRLCEMIIQSLNPTSQTDFVAVRFGNVLGSNGSVVPLFKKQIAKGGPVTLTHKEIVRYFMTIPEAAQLVLQAGGFAQGGEIFVLDMGKPVKIYDLAENLIKLSGYEPHTEIEIQVTGLRPGEKLYEELLMDEEGLTKTDHKKIFIGKPGDFELCTVKKQINELIVATTKGSTELKAKLKEVVPTYREPEHHKINVQLAQSNEEVMNRGIKCATTN